MQGDPSFVPYIRNNMAAVTSARTYEYVEMKLLSDFTDVVSQCILNFFFFFFFCGVGGGGVGGLT